MCKAGPLNDMIEKQWTLTQGASVETEHRRGMRVLKMRLQRYHQHLVLRGSTHLK